MNSELYGNQYKLPDRILKNIKAQLYRYPDSDGIKRAKNIINNPNITYQQLKRLKNFFDEYNPETTSTEQYDLAGGAEMKDFVEQTLKSERSRESSSAETVRPALAGVGDANVRAQNGEVNMNVHEGEDKSENEGEASGLSKNSVVVMFDDDMRILLLKRSSFPDQWMPNKLSLVGGGVDEGEDPLEGAKREVREETGIEVTNLLERFVIQREDNVEHMFVCKLPKQYNNDDITLDKENDGYLWVSYDEILKMDKEQLVPNLLEYIKIAVEKYE